MSKWTDDVVAEIQYAHKTSHTLLVSKYTSSKGVVSDYVVGLLPPTGYLEMVKSSLQILDASINSLKESKPPDVEMADWIVATSDLIISFRKTIKKAEAQQEVTSEWMITKPTIFKDGFYVYKSEEEADQINTIIVKNLFVESQVDHTQDITASLIPVSKVARAKHILRSTLPVGKYIAQLNFSEGKVESVKAVVIPE